MADKREYKTVQEAIDTACINEREPIEGARTFYVVTDCRSDINEGLSVDAGAAFKPREAK